MMAKITFCLIYGVSTNDYGWLRSSFYPIRQMEDSCKSSGTAFSLYTPEDFAAFINTLNQTEKCDFFRNNKLLLRGNISSEVYDILEQNKAIYTPKRNAKKLADDKLMSYCFFEKRKILQPKTVCQNEKTENFEQLKIKLDLPFIAKPRFGSMGKNVFLIKSKEQFELIFNCEDCSKYVFQQFIETKTAQKNRNDLRFFVIKNKVHAAVFRIAPESSDVASNAHQGGTMEQTEVPQNLKRFAVKIIKKARLDYGTADFLVQTENENAKTSKKNMFLCEINASPGFEALEAQTGINIAEKLIKLTLNLKK